jgi:hypothetical protein
MTKTVVGSFDTFEHARDVVTALEDMGVAQGDLNVVANDAAGRLAAGRGAGPSAGLAADPTDGALPDRDPSEGGDTGTGAAASAGRGAVAGGVIGGTAGLIAGLAGLAVPGVGPLVAAGPIAATLAGAGIGALAGGLIGGLRAVGVSDADAEYYAEAVRRGGALVVVKADDARATAIADTMRRHGAIDIDSRVAAWRASGWSGFDESAQPWTHEQIERERVAYRTGGGVPQALDRGPDAELRSGGMRGTPMAGGVGGRVGGGGAVGGVGGVGSDAVVGGIPRSGATPSGGTAADAGLAGTGTTTGSGTLGGASLGTGRGADHPNLGPGPDKPGVDTRQREHGSRAGMASGDDDAAPGSPRDTARRAGDAVERRIPGDSDGDGR